jgi:hypothetical protein
LSETGEIWSYNLIGGVFERFGVIQRKDKDIRRWHVERSKKPRTDDSYIGIELEYASKKSVSELRDVVADMRLHKQVRVVKDNSIEVNEHYPFKAELCVLSKFSQIDETMSRLSGLVNSDTFCANATCGLHIHLDARNGNVRRMYRNLAVMQSLLFRLAAPWRWNNMYCRPVTSWDITAPYDEDHYAAISKLSYREHGSVEVRIYHSTLDLDLIKKWIRLLKSIADYDGELEWPEVFMDCADMDSGAVQYGLEQLTENIKPNDEILKFVEERLSA